MAVLKKTKTYSYKKDGSNYEVDQGNKHRRSRGFFSAPSFNDLFEDSPVRENLREF